MEDNNQKLLEIKKDIRRIKKAGASAEFLGFFLILFSAAVIWSSGTISSLLLRFSVFVLLGIYFFYTGTYIKDGWGRRVKLALLLNGIIAFPLCALVIPVYTCVKSILNYSRFKDLPEKIQELYKQRKLFNVEKRDLILLAAILFVSLASFGFRLALISKNTATTRTTASSNQPVSYKSSKYNFSATFPSTPFATDFTEQVSGHDIPYTTYDSFAKHGTQDFNIYAYSWPAPFFNFSAQSSADMAKTVDSSLDSIVQGLKGTVVKSSPSTYQGHISEDAQFTLPTFGKTATGYIRVFYVGNYEYGIIALAANQSDFNNFANSFKSY